MYVDRLEGGRAAGRWRDAGIGAGRGIHGYVSVSLLPHLPRPNPGMRVHLRCRTGRPAISAVLHATSHCMHTCSTSSAGKESHRTTGHGSYV
jgi:hypothetical protein